MPLQNGQYIEVVCPLDHPAIEQTPWGKAVGKKAQRGGDFAANRIIPYLIRGVITRNPIEVSNLNSTRPWQHVLDPLLGYLVTLENTLMGLGMDSINFGPTEKVFSVTETVRIFESHSILREFQASVKRTHPAKNLEATDLMLDLGEVQRVLGVISLFSTKKSIEITFEWWEKDLSEKCSLEQACLADIQIFMEKLIHG
jgi:CDP-glucose 4,6-dehydratase